MEVSLVLDDVRINFNDLKDLTVSLVSDKAGIRVGRCQFSVSADGYSLHVKSPADNQRYLGPHRLVLVCAIGDDRATYDRPVVDLVATTAEVDSDSTLAADIDSQGVHDVDIPLSVTELNSSLIVGLLEDTEAARDAANAAADKALKVIESLEGKELQEKLVSGKNIKTINGQSLLGKGNIEIEGGGSSYDDTEVKEELARLEREKADKSELTELETQDTNFALGLSVVTDSYEKKPYNMWNGIGAHYERNQTTGEISKENKQYWCFADYVDILGNTEITITIPQGTPVKRKMVGGFVFCYDSNKNFISVVRFNFGNDAPLVLPSETKYIIYQSNYSGSEQTIPSDLMCSPYVEDWQEKGYEEYEPTHMIYTSKIKEEELLKKAEIASVPIPTSAKIGGYIGGKVEYGRGIVDDFVALSNSVGIIKSQASATILGTLRRHEPQMVVVGNVIYIACFENLSGYIDEAKSHGKVVLSVLNADNLELINEYEVSAQGMSVGNDTLAYGGGDPNIVALGNTIRIIWDAKTTNGGEVCLFYRDFNTSNNTFSSIGKCKIKDNSDTYDFTFDGIQSICGTFKRMPDNGINMDCQYALINGYYYIGLGVGDAYPNIPIIRTTDFITFELWMIPEFEGNDAKYECSLLYFNPSALDYPNWLLTATRQADGSILFAPIKLSNKEVTKPHRVPSGAMRPCLFNRKDGAYQIGMFHTLGGSRRKTACITTIEPYGFYDDQNYYMSHEIGEATYVTIVEYDNQHIIAYQSDNKIKVTKISDLYKYKWEDVVPKLGKFLEVL